MRRRRERTCLERHPEGRRWWRQIAPVALAAVLLAFGCGPSGTDKRDASSHDAHFPDDGGDPHDAALVDGAVDPDATVECTQSPVARTGTTVRLLNGSGVETGAALTVGTEVTVTVEVQVTTPPDGNIGFLLIGEENLAIDATSFKLGGQPMTTLPDPFQGRVPLTLTAGTLVVEFKATVVSENATIEVMAALGYGNLGSCPIALSHSLAILQVLGGQVKGQSCYDLDGAQSVQVAPYAPLESTSEYLTENGTWGAVEVNNLVVGSQCPDTGVLVHQIQKCFTRDASATVTLSGAAYGGVEWNVDDLFVVEVLDATENVLAAVTTYQLGTVVAGCCTQIGCESSCAYAAGGPGVPIVNLVQGGGDNGAIAAGAFDITPYLPPLGQSFFLRFTALDQGVQGRLDKVFLNIAH